MHESAAVHFIGVPAAAAAGSRKRSGGQSLAGCFQDEYSVAFAKAQTLPTFPGDFTLKSTKVYFKIP